MFEKVQNVFAKVLDIESIDVRMNSTIENLEGWDSMKHLELILEIEKEFKVEFEPHEIPMLNTVERIMTSVAKKQVGK